jgi:UDP-N-acetylmuramate dehydrogenase
MTAGDTAAAAGTPGPGDLAAADAVFADSVLAGRVQAQRPLGPLTTYRVGGAAARFVVVESMLDLRAVVQAATVGDLAVLVIGRGSNLLVSDDGFHGLAVQLGAAFADVDVRGTVVRAGGGAALPVVARRTASVGLTGFEWAVGVPGSIGGACRMNAGGHGSDMAACLTSVRVVDLHGDGAVRQIPASELALSYRHSVLRDDQVVVQATLALAVDEPDDALARVDAIVRWRREHQPGGQNAGSVFTNPPGDSAGRLIDTAGCKGLRHGTAEVSSKHANFIQADENGRAADVRALMTLVQERVHEVHGVWLVAETKLVGFAESRPAA